MTFDSINDLPERYREQAARQIIAAEKSKLTAKEEAKRSKYGNQKTEVEGIKFDSKKEAARYQELLWRLGAGEISDLKLQEEFTLSGAYTDTHGRRIRAIRYRCDFSYKLPDGSKVVEDVKSKATKTRVYEIKKKLLRERLGIEIVEI